MINNIIIAKIREDFTPIYIRKEQKEKYLKNANYIIFDLINKKLYFETQKEENGAFLKRAKIIKLNKTKDVALLSTKSLSKTCEYIFIDLENKSFEIFKNIYDLSMYFIKYIAKKFFETEVEYNNFIKILDDQNNETLRKILELKKLHISFGFLLAKFYVISYLFFFKYTRREFAEKFGISVITLKNNIKIIEKYIYGSNI